MTIGRLIMFIGIYSGLLSIGIAMIGIAIAKTRDYMTSIKAETDFKTLIMLKSNLGTQYDFSNINVKNVESNQIKYNDQVHSFQTKQKFNFANITGYGWLDNTSEDYKKIRNKSIKIVDVRKNREKSEQLPLEFGG
jgi:hypothetical protein